MVSENSNLLYVLERLKVKFGFGDITVAQLCKEYKFSPELFLAICNIYTSENYTPSVENLTKADLLKLVDYLLFSHKFYQNKSLPSLHKKIHKLLEGGDKANQVVLNKFYDDYYAEIHNHFKYEEECVFPYIRNLLKKEGNSRESINIVQFAENHDNIEDKLSDLKSIVLKYLPEDYSQTIRLDVLRSIFEIEADLCRHTMVEDKLLIPTVKKFEKQME